MVNFFWQNFIDIILRYRWVDLSTYFGHMDNLKKWHFFHRTPYRLQLVTVHKKVYFGVKTIAVKTKLHCSMYLTYGTYQKGRISLPRAQGMKRQVIIHCAYVCPKINLVMLWNKVTGSLASLSMICLASKILGQLGCHLLWLCGSVGSLLLCMACERRWQGLSINCLTVW
jgi:hypothetical protein